MSLHDAIMPFVPSLRRYARALVDDAGGNFRVADELVQSTVLGAVKDERLCRGGNIRISLYRILTALNRTRLHAVDPKHAGTSAGASARRSGLQGANSHCRIERALAMLAPEQREALLLVALERMSYEEAAEVLEIPLVTMLTRLTRARDDLRHRFNGAGAPEAPQRHALSRASGHLRLVK